MASGTILAQGRGGHVAFSTDGSTFTLMPVYSWNIQAPRNRITGDPVGNTFSTNFADGIITSRFTARMMVAKSLGGVLDPTVGLIKDFIKRVIDADSGMDVTIPYWINASDANSLHALTGAKPESFVMRIQKGQPIGLEVTFVSIAKPTRSDDRAASVGAIYAREVDQNFKMMMYNDVRFSKASDPSQSFTNFDNFYGIDINYSNNSIMNAPLDGTQGALSWDAGVMRAGADFTLRAYSGVTADPQPINDGDAIKATFTFADSSTTALGLTSVVPTTDLDGSADIGASFRQWRTFVLGKIISGSAYQPVTLDTNGVTVLA